MDDADPTLSPAWTPRHLAYCTAHGVEPAGEPGRDVATWLLERWTTWKAERGLPLDDAATLEQHADFDAWLSAQAKP